MRRFTALAACLALAGVACSSNELPRITEPQSDPASKVSVAIVPASASECPDGGVALVSFVDANENGTLDAGETTRSRQKVCDGARGSTGQDGAPGPQGAGAGIEVSDARLEQCPAGGLVLMTYR